jgi:uncharacterized membrane protein (UPF0127 family)
MNATRRLAAMLLTLLCATLLGACGSTPPAGAAATTIPTTTVGGEPTAIATPGSTPTPAIAGQPIASTSALPRAALPLVEFVHDGKTIASLPIEVLPPAEFSVGFSGRPSLLDQRGMLFYYPRMGRGAFWMKDTHFDLAIAFVADDGQIVDIEEMHREATTVVTPKADYRYAIEAPAGWYLAHGVGLRDLARLAFPLPAYLTNH